MRGPWLAAVIVALSASLAHADDCAKATTQQALNACADASARAADAAMTTLYHRIQDRIGTRADAAVLLVKAQRRWIAFRDAECLFATEAARNGSIQPMLRAGCAEALTRKRIADFKTYLNCPEGDLSCTLPAR